jgi:lipopolysaccharide/colanic/teichoic acid biosynthesis glycosyltransferase
LKVIAQRQLTGHPTARAGEIIAAGLILLACLPLMLFVALAIKWDSTGPILVQRRRMARGHFYIVLKFRTTYDGREFGHITRVGRFLRYSSIESLPQLLNVFRGEMSCLNFASPERPFFLN